MLNVCISFGIAIKDKHILTLAVDGISVGEPQAGKAEISAADTNDPLYIGGVAGWSEVIFRDSF